MGQRLRTGLHSGCPENCSSTVTTVAQRQGPEAPKSETDIAQTLRREGRKDCGNQVTPFVALARQPKLLWILLYHQWRERVPGMDKG